MHAFSVEKLGAGRVCADSSGQRLELCGRTQPCGPHWGDLHRCKVLCSQTPRCNYIIHSVDQTCWLYSHCSEDMDKSELGLGDSTSPVVYAKGALISRASPTIAPRASGPQPQLHPPVAPAAPRQSRNNPAVMPIAARP
eukprot:5688800-Prymnesium_polylepis.1